MLQFAYNNLKGLETFVEQVVLDYKRIYYFDIFFYLCQHSVYSSVWIKSTTHWLFLLTFSRLFLLNFCLLIIKIIKNQGVAKIRIKAILFCYVCNLLYLWLINIEIVSKNGHFVIYIFKNQQFFSSHYFLKCGNQEVYKGVIWRYNFTRAITSTVTSLLLIQYQYMPILFRALIIQRKFINDGG